ncbi:MAG: keto-deoxy-phosphogluconate aldolase, partial [Mesorhizobium sp.]
MTSKTEKLLSLLNGQPVIPVLKIAILDAKQFDEAARAGSKFIVSPGITSQLLDAAKDSPVPLLPGAITPGEIMAAREAGLRFLKFFPAEQSGGIASLKA